VSGGATVLSGSVVGVFGFAGGHLVGFEGSSEVGRIGLFGALS
jgi:hypothetical protein